MTTASILPETDIATVCGAAGIRRIRLPMQSVREGLDHANAWLVGEPSSLALVDTGPNGQQNWKLLMSELEGSGGSLDVYCTHGHTDHAGHAAALARRLEVRLHMTRIEWSWARRRFARRGPILEAARSEFLKSMGIQVPAKTSPSRDARIGDALDLPTLSCELRNGDIVEFGSREWRVEAGGGHSPLAACFYDSKGTFIITGDQVLPGMTPFVGVDWEEPEAEPISQAIAFLKTISDLPKDVIGLPGHGRPFLAIGARAAAHIDSYLGRAERAHRAASEPQTCAALVPSMFRGDMDGPERDVMLTMAAAILNYLVADRRMVRWLEDDGVYRYRAC